MQLNVAFTLLAVVASALAAPTGTELSNRAADVDGNLYVCTDANWGGECTLTSDECNNMISGFQDNISSFGPDVGWECTTYTDINCTGATYADHQPGFTTLPAFINDNISSFSYYFIYVNIGSVREQQEQMVSDSL
ncbi:hypothetical protein BDQ17DRAFT_1428284 [Cyathus striatus]|nr:hypothetical protein BDQ17DRAFT_1428284 [Cyathus striatus]